MKIIENESVEYLRAHELFQKKSETSSILTFDAQKFDVLRMGNGPKKGGVESPLRTHPRRSTKRLKELKGHSTASRTLYSNELQKKGSFGELLALQKWGDFEYHTNVW